MNGVTAAAGNGGPPPNPLQPFQRRLQARAAAAPSRATLSA